MKVGIYMSERTEVKHINIQPCDFIFVRYMLVPQLAHFVAFPLKGT